MDETGGYAFEGDLSQSSLIEAVFLTEKSRI